MARWSESQIAITMKLGANLILIAVHKIFAALRNEFKRKFLHVVHLVFQLRILFFFLFFGFVFAPESENIPVDLRKYLKSHTL
ncbi:CLUMA_CG008788, isoform A [Clunio marinus]|uniref:CLUMA_CG008788, isoform A n=1 Tax=Clunio marinus TaxID=568069 RepID=A0A1J1I9S4_9DIPT|nr:CLUMA_CG008788, isoform A [Clunio marinus]